MANPLQVYSAAELAARRSMKWREYPPDVLPMWVAETDTPLAPPIRAALVAALDRGDTGYAYHADLADAFAGFAARRYGWRPDAAHMVQVPDVLQAISEAIQLVTGVGDGVVLDTPAYPAFLSHLPAIGRRVVGNPMANGRIDLAGLERAFAGGARAYLLCNPHNPTGTVADLETLHTIAELADRYGVRLVVDEIHAPVTYPGVVHVPFATLDAEAAGRAFVAVSASKAWNLAGLKAALLVAGPEAVADLRRLPPELWVSVGILGVIAGAAAFSEGEPWLDGLLAALDENRKLLAVELDRELPRIGYQPPDATYLAWLDCQELGLGDDPAAVFLDRGHVALSPGPLFGEPGRGFVRFNLGTSPERIREAVARMARAVG
ncbi:aminotransferase class I/II-fold pyridoxal phosphate-dependent enzyme [Streptomyces sp. AJS327]|uniref:MalY/PatB family protein n=1 Tax=Streptomyces sp. AJS327 TaxID=2545265 RepID=UPI0015DF2C52|nr:aminotransferase class I/II-fold pyridoxal phosphate-dependent enzyme [Streptomyces sp. AJS327]MBA0051197.1 aminotransferase class I/II-fold pyridoxal phosphate-dependent enzyme [Streptomyces sp. AJS327]